MIIQILKAGYNILLEKREEDEANSSGVFRAGNAGYVAYGKSNSSCPRLTLARYFGQKSGAPSKSIEFEEHLNVTTGVLHEHHVTDLLVASPSVSKVEAWEKLPQQSDKIVCHESPVKWVIDEKTVVSGRPDRVVTIDGQRIGLELKSVISQNTAFKINTGFPSEQYISQILVYQHNLQIPFYFLFGQYFIADKFVNKKPVKLQPQFSQFKVVPDSTTQTAVIKLDSQGREIDTKIYNIGIKHVEDYYKLCSEAVDSASLPDVPLWEGYNKCDYCPFLDRCNSYDAGIISRSEWLGGK